MGEEFLRRSKISGKKYDVFSCVRILNPLQAAAYIDNNAELLDVYISRDSNNKRVMVFLFNREATTELYERWCSHTL